MTGLALRQPAPAVDATAVASRAQGVGTHLHNAPVILCRHVNQLLTAAPLDEDYGAILDSTASVGSIGR